MTSVQVTGARGGVVFTASNALQSASLLTAANPSAANGNVGSRWILNDGSGPIVWQPSVGGETTLTAQVSTGAPMFSGPVLAMHPTQNVPYATYVPKNVSVDQTVPLLESGNTVVSTEKVASERIQASAGAMVYFDASSSGVTAGTGTVTLLEVLAAGTTLSSTTGYIFDVYNGGFSFGYNDVAYITGTNTDVEFMNRVVIKGANDNAKFRVLDATDTVVFTVGTVSREVVSRGNFYVSGVNNTRKMVIMNSDAEDLVVVDTFNEMTRINQGVTMSGYVIINGADNPAKFNVATNTGNQIFNVSTTGIGSVISSGAFVIDGANSVRKMVIMNSDEEDLVVVDTVGEMTRINQGVTMNGYVIINSADNPGKFTIMNNIGEAHFNVSTTGFGSVGIRSALIINGANGNKFTIRNNSDSQILNISTLGIGLIETTAVMIISGTNNAAKFIIKNSTDEMIFNVNTQTAGVYVATLSPVSGSSTVGTVLDPFADVRSLLINGASDARIKNIGQPLDRIKCYDAVKNMDLYDFEYKATGAKALGFIAQQLKDVVAELPEGIVTGDESTIYSVNLMSIVAVLTGAIQRLIAVVEERA